ncbi:MFSD5 [Symbiodinium sp. KB8]|nr:MFSD5 [Symbiodinium sp. KB8]
MLAPAYLYGCICAGLVATTLVIVIDRSSIQMLKGLVSTGTSDGLSRLQRIYLSVYLSAMMADWLQGPFVYALYASYGFSREDNATLFVAGFGSSALFGTFIGSMADKYGRRRFAALYCVLYFMSCLTKHFKSMFMLLIGRLTGGIATSLLFSVFDSWLVSEHNARGYSSEQLSGSFSIAFFGNSLVAIAAGEVGQFTADLVPLTPLVGSLHYGGYTWPFVAANCFLVLCLGLMISTWSENFGQTAKEAAMEQTKDKGFMGAVNLVMAQPLILWCGIVCSLFESSMFIFVFNWTPVLMKVGEPDPPFGHIFAGFMIFCMLGSRLFSMAVHSIPNERIGMYTLIVAALCHGSILFVDSESIHLLAFFIFEMCVGIYFPMMGTMKGQIVPESKRSTIYNLYRVPLNAIVVLTLILKLGEGISFMATTTMLCVAAFAQARIIKLGGARPVTLPAPTDEDKELVDQIGKSTEAPEEAEA